MYEDTIGCNFDPNSMPESAESVLSLNPLPPPPPPQVLMPSPSETHNNNNNSFAVAENLRLSMEELSYPHQQDHHAAMEIELQNELGFNPYSTNTDQNNHSSHLVSFEQQTNWDNIHGVHDQMQQQLQDGANGAYPPTPDLLNLFSLPRCSPSSVLQNSSITFTNPNQKSSNFPNSLGFLGDVHGGIDTPPGTASSVLYDPLFHLNLPPQPPLFREMLQSLPHGYSLPGSRNGSLFSSGGDEREGIGGGVYSDGINNGRQFENGVLEFSREMGSIGRGRDVKGTKHFATEKHRRVQLNGKYTALKDLLPHPTKSDRASIVGEAIDYIKELLRTVEELKLLVEKKRCGRERSKRRRTEQDGGAGDDESCNMKPLGDPHDQSYNNGSLRSSWLQRKSKDTEVDIRIIDDEVTIKLVQRKKINLLLYVSKLLDELQLDLHHVAGGHIGNSYSFLFNTKMYEGSSLYASAIAQKLIEVLDIQYAAVPPTNSF
ncbi:hypothetical protein ACE6H2_007018 [Prunus campanulata]|uniref:BHLH transcription factor n=1 Tax=Prunus pseudocerasus TaxID=151439 RepID=A0A0U2S887_9ROSA|nr:bHLH transcription factor [Prunus pseudocerasus]